MKKSIGLLGLFAVIFAACGEDETMQPFTGPQLPSNFPTPVYDLSRNPVT